MKVQELRKLLDKIDGGLEVTIPDYGGEPQKVRSVCLVIDGWWHLKCHGCSHGRYGQDRPEGELTVSIEE